MTRLLLLAALAALLAPSADAQTCTTSWAAPVDGSWTDATKWTNGAPSTDSGGLSPCITVAGTYTVSYDVGVFGGSTVTSFVLGGASGTQTLTLFSGLSVTDASIRPNGVLVPVGNVGNTQGLYATGTVTLEGVVDYGSGSFLRSGGTLDIAPSGTLRVSGQAGAGAVSGLFRVRGTIEGVGCPVPNAGDCRIDAPLEVLGGTLRAADGVLRTSAGGTMNGATLDAGPAGFLTLNADIAGPPYQYTVEGTIQGDPEGFVAWSGVRVAAGPAGATFAVGGTGLQLAGSSNLASGGGSFTNAGLLREAEAGSNFSSFNGALIRNTGTVEFPSGFEFYNGAVLRNEPGGTVWLSGAGNIGTQGAVYGRIENAGLLLRDGNRPATGTGVTLNGLLRSLPGSEIRILGDTQLNLDAPGSRTLPVGVTLTGDGAVGIPFALEPEGTISPGTDAEPLAALTVRDYFRPSLVAGSPRLVIDVDASGQSDTLDVLFAPGSRNTRLGGALVVRVRPGFTPSVGDAWTILTSGSAIEGQFAQIVAQDAPEGIAFVTEVSADGLTLTLSAVAVAPDGPITVSTTMPINGGVRPIFLTGPGASGVSAARLECTTCLDPDAFGTIPATLAQEGALTEARFDLTSPRAYGLYDLVLTRAGLDDERVPVTVRPYMSYIRTAPSITRGIGVRPVGLDYNWSSYEVFNSTNADEPTYPFSSVGREDRQQVDFALASGNAFVPGVVVFYESATAPDPTASALTSARIASGGSVLLNYGLRTAPSNVLFPEQTPSGPNDPRLPFGEARIFSAFSVQHTSFARARDVIEAALRNTPNTALRSYLAQVDAADAEAVRLGIQEALRSQPTYVAGVDALLARTLAAMNATASTPSGLAAQAADDFARTLDVAVYRLYADVEYAYHLDLETAPEAVQALIAAEYEALAGGTPARRENALTRVCESGDLLRSVGISALNGLQPPPPTVVDIDNVILCQLQDEARPPRLSDNPFPSETSTTFRNIATQLNNVARTLNDGFLPALGAPRRAGTCSPSSGGGGGGGGSAGVSCTPPAAPADPNDKTAETSLLCQFGAVTVDGETQTRCVRYFVPLAEASDPILYTIQFENLPQATANAEYVTITDTLDAALNPATLEVYATSSDSTFSYSTSGQVVTFRFVGIDLPPNVTSPEGQGFITYAVRPYSAPPTGTVIRNRASIVFDFNPAIATPEVVHEVREAADVSVVIDAPDFVTVGGPLAFDVVVANLQGDPAGEVTVTIDTGALSGVSASTTGGSCTGSGPVVCSFGTLDAATFERVTITSAAPTRDVYTVTASGTTTAFDGFAANDSDQITSGVVGVGVDDDSDLPREVTLASVYPNPARSATTLRWGLPEAGRVRLTVVDLLGREVAGLADGEAAAGWHETRWEASVASGVYVVRLETGATVRTRKLVVVR